MSEQMSHDSGIPAVYNREATLDEEGNPERITVEVRVPDGCTHQSYLVTYKAWHCIEDGDRAKLYKYERKSGSASQDHWMPQTLTALYRAQRALEDMGVDVVGLDQMAEDARAQAYRGNSLTCSECEQRFTGRDLEEDGGGKPATDWCPSCGASATSVKTVAQQMTEQQAD